AALPAGERRKLTVLFCDLVGSTPLSQQLDTEEWRDLIAQYQQAATSAVARFGGHLALKLGDGLLIYFGWPAAHEDDPERAVRAGLNSVPREPVAMRVCGVATRPASIRLVASTFDRNRSRQPGDRTPEADWPHEGGIRPSRLPAIRLSRLPARRRSVGRILRVKLRGVSGWPEPSEPWLARRNGIPSAFRSRHMGMSA